MHCSTSTIVAAGLCLLGAVSAVPVQQRDVVVQHYEVNGIVEYLDAQGKLEWTEVEGGRVIHIPSNQAVAALGNLTTAASGNKGKSNVTVPSHKRQSQQTTPDGWDSSHSWSNVGEIDGWAARIACIGTGDKVLADVVSSGLTTACTNIVQNIPGVALIENGWTVFQQTGLADASGAAAYLNWRFGYLGSSSDNTLTQSGCTAAANSLAGSSCTAEGQTKGGSIEVGGSSLGWIFGFDPNST